MCQRKAHACTKVKQVVPHTKDVVESEGRKMRTIHRMTGRTTGRNTLYEKALTLCDMKLGLRIQQRSTRSKNHPPSFGMNKSSYNNREGIVVGPPFTANFSANIDGIFLPVVIFSAAGYPIYEAWSARDLGLTPYLDQDGRPFKWNEQNYVISRGMMPWVLRTKTVQQAITGSPEICLFHDASWHPFVDNPLFCRGKRVETK